MIFKKDNLTNRIGNSYTTAPEIHRLIKRGPLETNQENLWSILEKTDVYAVGSIIYTLYDFVIPNISFMISNNKRKVPIFPLSGFSPRFIEFMSKLISLDPFDRPLASQAVRDIECMLFGPSQEIRGNSKALENWLSQKRLVYFFNLQNENGQEEKEFMNVIDSVLRPSFEKARLDFFLRISVDDLL